MSDYALVPVCGDIEYLHGDPRAELLSRSLGLPTSISWYTEHSRGRVDWLIRDLADQNVRARELLIGLTGIHLIFRGDVCFSELDGVAMDFIFAAY